MYVIRYSPENLLITTLEGVRVEIDGFVSCEGGKWVFYGAGQAVELEHIGLDVWGGYLTLA